MEKVSFRIRVKNHLRRHKDKYLTGGVCLAIVGTIGLYISGIKRMGPIPSISNGLSSENLTSIKSNEDNILNSLNIMKHIGRNGHPGNVIYCNETKQVFKSHREATRELGINTRDLWAYFKGMKPTARGFTFKTIGEAQDSE